MTSIAKNQPQDPADRPLLGNQKYLRELAQLVARATPNAPVVSAWKYAAHVSVDEAEPDTLAGIPAQAGQHVVLLPQRLDRNTTLDGLVLSPVTPKASTRLASASLLNEILERWPSAQTATSELSASGLARREAAFAIDVAEGAAFAKAIGARQSNRPQLDQVRAFARFLRHLGEEWFALPRDLACRVIRREWPKAYGAPLGLPDLETEVVAHTLFEHDGDGARIDAAVEAEERASAESRSRMHAEVVRLATTTSASTLKHGVIAVRRMIDPRRMPTSLNTVLQHVGGLTYELTLHSRVFWHHAIDAGMFAEMGPGNQPVVYELLADDAVLTLNVEQLEQAQRRLPTEALWRCLMTQASARPGSQERIDEKSLTDGRSMVPFRSKVRTLRKYLTGVRPWLVGETVSPWLGMAVIDYAVRGLQLRPIIVANELVRQAESAESARWCRDLEARTQDAEAAVARGFCKAGDRGVWP
jgi:hypothetical protein